MTAFYSLTFFRMFSALCFAVTINPCFALLSYCNKQETFLEKHSHFYEIASFFIVLQYLGFLGLLFEV